MNNCAGAGQPYSTEIPLQHFMKSYFEVSVQVSVPTAAPADRPGDASGMGTVSATIHGHAHEAKESRANRIMSMRAQELVHIKFDPLPKDDVISEVRRNLNGACNAICDAVHVLTTMFLP